MSYSFSTTVPKDQILRGLDKAMAAAGLANPEEHVSDHLRAALATMPELACAVGRSTDEVLIVVSGHANPGHGEPLPGGAIESITVSVAAVPPDADDRPEGSVHAAPVPEHPTTGLVGAPGDQATRTLTAPDPVDGDHDDPDGGPDPASFATAE